MGGVKATPFTEAVLAAALADETCAVSNDVAPNPEQSMAPTANTPRFLFISRDDVQFFNCLSVSLR